MAFTVLKGAVASQAVAKRALAATFKSYTLSLTTGSYAVTGYDAQETEAHQLYASKGAYSYTGIAANFAITEPASYGSYNVTGTAVAANYASYPTKGAYSVTGVAATFALAEPATSGVYSLNGNNSFLAYGRVFNLSSGSFGYTINNVPMETTHQKVLYVPIGHYNVTFQSYQTTAIHALFASGGIFGLSPNPVSLYSNHKLYPASGSYGYTGDSSQFSINFNLPAVPFVITGNPAQRVIVRLPLQTGAFTLAGNTVTFAVAINTTSQAYALTGYAATLKHNYAEGVTTNAYAINSTGVTLAKKSYEYLTSAQFTLSPKSVFETVNRNLVLAKGAYIVTGNAVAEFDKRRIYATSGNYVLTGNNVSLLIPEILSFTGTTDIIRIPAESRVIKVSA
jgi:hypothetical protein